MQKYAPRNLTLMTIALCLIAAACARQEVDDAAITTQVKAKFIADGRVSPTRVSVETTNGVVTLKGAVPTPQEKDAAEQVARTVEGVKGVKNEVKVDPATAGTGVPSVDELKARAKETAGEVAQGAESEAKELLLLTKVKTRLVAAGLSHVSAKVKRGEVTLTGEVKSEKERIAAETIVEKVDGVQKVNNQLTVKPR
jgi:osmotically-inducible protein OsmY